MTIVRTKNLECVSTNSLVYMRTCDISVHGTPDVSIRQVLNPDEFDSLAQKPVSALRESQTRFMAARFSIKPLSSEHTPVRLSAACPVKYIFINTFIFIHVVTSK
jgi:hypothetical protein